MQESDIEFDDEDSEAALQAMEDLDPSELEQESKRKGKKKPYKNRAWCFTINIPHKADVIMKPDPSLGEVDPNANVPADRMVPDWDKAPQWIDLKELRLTFTHLVALENTNNQVKYITWQLEYAPTTYQVHYQGYVEFYSQVNQATVKDWLDFRDQGRRGPIHVEGRRGSREEAKNYCHKEESRVPRFDLGHQLGLIPEDVIGPCEGGDLVYATPENLDLDWDEKLALRGMIDHYKAVQAGTLTLVRTTVKGISRVSWKMPDWKEMIRNPELYDQ